MNPIILYPHYGGTVHIESVRQLYMRARDPEHPRSDIGGLAIADASSSLLPHTFNILLCNALAARDQGQATHAIMLHSDIAPEAGWLDKLVTEYLRAGVDLLSVVVPIKDQDENPRTSTAVFDTTNPWEPKRYIRLADRESMPKTFRPADVCGPGEVLGVNTGLWIARLDAPWWNGFAFEFQSRIINVSGVWTAQIRPEDWELSRWIEAHGGTYAATWGVRVSHYGEAAWGNG